MKTTPPAPAGVDGYVPKTAWGRFWFSPTDPATLGFMRVITGLLVLYVHAAHSFDLKAFFGPDGWWGRDDVNRQRAEAPIARPAWGWEEANVQGRPPIQTPLIADRRAAVFDFLKNLPEDKVRRDADLAYLYFLLEAASRPQLAAANNYVDGLMMVKRSAGFLEEQRERMAAGLGREKFDARELPLSVPVFFLTMPPAERVRVWNDSQRFLSLMPANEMNFNYVLDWLLEFAAVDRATDRAELFKYLRDMKAGPEGRRDVEYLETWHQGPDRTYDRGLYAFSVWFHLTDPTAMWACHVLILAVIVLFTLGAFTRVTSVLTWLAALFYIHRNQQVLFGMDTMMNILLFYLMIGPSGAAFSVDRLVARWRAARALNRAGGQHVAWAEAVLAGPRPSSLANFAVRLFQIHFCFIYMSSGLSKLKGTMWWDTTATWFTIANPEFCPLMPYQPYQWFLYQVASIRPLLLFVFAAVTYFTLFLEISLPFLVWTRLRPYVVTLAIFLHTGIAWVMGLTCFGLLMLTLLLCYVPASVVRERLTWPRGSGPQLVVRFNGRNARQARVATFLRAFDLAGQITFHDEAGKGDGPVELVGDDGRPRTGYELFAYAWRKLLFLNLISWVLWVPGVSALVRRLVGIPAPAGTGVKGPPAMPGVSKKPAAS